MSRAARRLRAWHSAFDLAAELFRLTAHLDDRACNGFRGRIRRRALEVPGRIARALTRNSRKECAGDLQRAREALDAVVWQARLLAVVAALDGVEGRSLDERLARCRADLDALALRVEPAPEPLGRGRLVEGAILE